MTPRSSKPWLLRGRRAARAGEGVDWKVRRVGGYEIHWVEYGAEGTPVILLHGLSGSSRWWARNIAGLAERHRVILPDLIGFGRSPRPSGRLPAVADVARVLANWMEEQEIGRAHVVGHSMGGQIAAHLAAEHPDRVDRLVLVAAAGIPRPLTPRAVARFGIDIAPLWRWGDPRFLPVILGDAWTAGPITLLQAIGHILVDDIRPLLPKIVAPTLVIWGERDTWVPLSHAWQIRSRIPNARLAVLRGAAHVPMVDRPADFNRMVLSFFDGQTIGR